MHQIVQNYSNKYCYLSGVNNFWAVQTVITSIKSLNKQGKNESRMRFDFFVYTLRYLIVLNKLSDFCFDGGSHN